MQVQAALAGPPVGAGLGHDRPSTRGCGPREDRCVQRATRTVVLVIAAAGPRYSVRMYQACLRPSCCINRQDARSAGPVAVGYNGGALVGSLAVMLASWQRPPSAAAWLQWWPPERPAPPARGTRSTGHCGLSNLTCN